MKSILAFSAVSMLPLLALAQATSPPAAAPPGSTKELAKAGEPAGDSPLVRAAKASRATRKKPSRVVIDNDDVKNSKGKLIFVQQKPIDTTASKAPPPLPDEKPRQVPATAITAKRVDDAKTEVASLEKELARLEEDYYSEDDANYRDQVIEARFEQAKKQLENARQKLLDARDVQQQLEDQAATRPSNP